MGGSKRESPKSILGVICAAFENMFPSFDDHSVDEYVKALPNCKHWGNGEMIPEMWEFERNQSERIASFDVGRRH